MLTQSDLIIIKRALTTLIGSSRSKHAHVIRITSVTCRTCCGNSCVKAFPLHVPLALATHAHAIAFFSPRLRICGHVTAITMDTFLCAQVCTSCERDTAATVSHRVFGEHVSHGEVRIADRTGSACQERILHCRIVFGNGNYPILPIGRFTMPKTQRPATSDLLRDQSPRQLAIHNVHVLATSRPPRADYGTYTMWREENRLQLKGSEFLLVNCGF